MILVWRDSFVTALRDRTLRYASQQAHGPAVIFREDSLQAQRPTCSLIGLPSASRPPLLLGKRAASGSSSTCGLNSGIARIEWTNSA
jgi:hypothetical protein